MFVLLTWDVNIKSMLSSVSHIKCLELLVFPNIMVLKSNDILTVKYNTFISILMHISKITSQKARIQILSIRIVLETFLTVCYVSWI